MFKPLITENAFENIVGKMAAICPGFGVNKLRSGEKAVILQTTFPIAFSKITDIWISIKISPDFVPKFLIHNKPALIQVMVWRRTDDMPLSEPMMVHLTDRIYILSSLDFVTLSHWNILVICYVFVIMVPLRIPVYLWNKVVVVVVYWPPGSKQISHSIYRVTWHNNQWHKTMVTIHVH